ncbi:MAG: SurA N-terminal domain-containing protein [Hyphomonadaceae bacterium]|nr:SurA N-terminal domain-containing protein [Hyphomonadaceae bacterium]
MFRSFALASLMAISGSLTLSAQELAPAAPEAQQIEGIVAVVNDDPISFTDVRQRARLLLLSLGGQQPTQEQVQQITAQALEQLIDEKLQLQEAAEYEVEVSDAEIASSIDRLAQQSGITRDNLLQSLIQSGVNPASLEEQTRADIAWRRIMGGLYGSRIRISDNQITEQLKRLRADAQKEQYLTSEIFLYAPLEEDKRQALVAADSILQQLRAGAPFEVAAQRFSSAPTAATGGDMGWIVLDSIDDARRDALQQMTDPGLTEPVEVEDGIYIMNVRGKRDPSDSTTVVDVTRVSVDDGSEASLQEAIARIGSCDEIEDVVADDGNLRSVALEDLNVEDLGPEGQSMVLNTEIGSATDIFAQSGTLAVMFVCDRRDNVEAIPNRDQIEDRLYSQQLGMISERSLRNLRREATIIRRQ